MPSWIIILLLLVVISAHSNHVHKPSLLPDFVVSMQTRKYLNKIRVSACTSTKLKLSQTQSYVLVQNVSVSYIRSLSVVNIPFITILLISVHVFLVVRL